MNRNMPIVPPLPLYRGLTGQVDDSPGKRVGAPLTYFRSGLFLEKLSQAGGGRCLGIAYHLSPGMLGVPLRLEVAVHGPCGGPGAASRYTVAPLRVRGVKGAGGSIVDPASKQTCLKQDCSKKRSGLEQHLFVVHPWPSGGGL